MINTLKNIGSWFLGSADKLDKLDDNIKAQINAQTRRAFYIGAACGLAVAVAVMRVL